MPNRDRVQHVLSFGILGDVTKRLLVKLQPF